MEFNGTFLVTIVTFILFVLLMNKILYAPILNVMEERKNFIDENYKFAESNNNKSQEILEEKEVLLGKTREKAKKRYVKSLDKYKTKKDAIVTNAQNEAKEDIEVSQVDLENLSNEVKAGLKSRMSDLADDIVEKVIGYRSNIDGFNDEEINKILYR